MAVNAFSGVSGAQEKKLKPLKNLKLQGSGSGGSVGGGAYSQYAILLNHTYIRNDILLYLL